MSYLVRLKELEARKNITNTLIYEPAKPPKAPFDPFAGSHLRNSENDSESPDIGLEERQELQQLVHLVCNHHNFSKSDYTEALELALGDQVNSPVCFTMLARQEGLT